MAVVEFEYQELKKELDLQKKEMIDLFNSIGAPAEENGENIVLELTPNRPDWFSKEGIVRSIKAYCNGTLKEYVVKKKSGYSLMVGAVPFRQCVAWAVVKGLEFDDQRIKDIIRLQDKLGATLGRKVKRFGIGFYPMQNIEFPIRYVLMEPNKINYRPLGYEREVNASEILREHPKGKEYGYLLSGQKKYPVYIDAGGRIMCLIPIVNSAETGKVDENTKNVLVEVTGTHQNSVDAALNIICCSLIDAGGTVESIEVHQGRTVRNSPELKESKIRVDVDRVNKLLGTEFSMTQIKKYLKRMGYRTDDKCVYVPPYRADIMNFVDVIEDIAIAHGYNNFEVTLPDFFSKGSIAYDYQEVHSVLRGLGFTEVKTFVLSNKTRMSLIGNGKQKEVLNPCTEDFSVIRDSLMIDALEVFERNKTKGLPQKIYEIGEVFENEKTKTKVVFAVMDKNITFSEFRGYLQTILFEKGIVFELKKERRNIFDEKESGSIETKECTGVIGKVNNKTLELYNIAFPIYLCELSFE